ncbi:hypothetical protein [Agromyces bracchium]|uniref:Exo-alpha-sialidase n=1 Tax=Agromyces bracchium TaxID=88376 RepID=A0A6I3MDX4_9MICO|nr:hypothetical protein [Agromyces bracchium]MTH69596.1 hypothetical protein [Agromyces bracchium]
MALGVLAVVAGGLAYAAMTQFETPSTAGSTPGAAPSSTGDAVVESDDPSTLEEPAESTPAAVAPGRVITALDASFAVRAVSTTCPAPTAVEVSSDAGANWRAIPADPVSAAQRVDWDGDSYLAVLGSASDGCASTFDLTWTAGDDWDSAPDELTAEWFVDPGDRATVHSPTGAQPAPCRAVLQLAASDDDASAAALCDDATVHATVDGGQTWLAAGPIAGAGAIGAGDAGVFRVAVIDQTGCTGAQLGELSVVDGTAVLGALGACLAAAVPAGAVAVDTATDGSTWVWAGDVIGRSTDGGLSWL